MVTRAAVRTIAAFAGHNAPKDRIDLIVDQSEAHLGSVVTGSVTIHGRSPIKTVSVVFEGTEYTVVALPRTSDNQMGLEYLKKNTSETRCVTRQEISLNCTTPQVFRFAIPNDIPSTMRCRLDGTDPILPSQCQVKYVITATIYRNHAKTQVSHPICILPEKKPRAPLDPSITVAIGSSLDVVFKSLFSCGGRICQVDSPGAEPIADENYILLESSADNLHLSAGQRLQVIVQDWFGLFNKSHHIWMVRIVERLSWKAQGRTARSREVFDLYANHHEIPTTLRRSHDQDPKSLLQVSHEIFVYATSKNNRKEVLATTEPIPIQIVSTNRGWEA